MADKSKSKQKSVKKTSRRSVKLSAEAELIRYKRQVKQKLNEISEVLAPIAIGDFSHNLQIPEEEDEFTEVYVGIQLMIEVIRDNIAQLQQLNEQLSGNIRRIEEVNRTIEHEKVIDEAVLESIGEGMIVVNKQERVVIVNNQAEQMLGRKIKDIIGKHWLELVEISDSAGKPIGKDEDPIHQALTLRRKVRLPILLFKTFRHSELPVAVTASPIAIGKNLLGVVMVFRDMSEERDIDKAKTEVVSFTSHQLRTPLSVINWYSEVLLGEHPGPLNKKQKEYTEAIQFTTRRMIELVNTFLSVSRIQLGTLVMENQDFQVRDVLASALQEFDQHVESRELTIKVENDSSDDTISGDPKLVRVIFQNLIHNAVKYTPNGGTVTIKWCQPQKGSRDIGRDYLLVAISDTGYGIPAKEQGRIFTKLFRAENAQQIDTEGSGLGLYMVKSIVNYMGGEVWFQSALNKGTTFFVALPLIAEQQKNLRSGNEGTKRI